MTQSRFNIPYYRCQSILDSESCEVEQGKITLDEGKKVFKLTLLRPYSVPAHVPPIVTEVKYQGKVIWEQDRDPDCVYNITVVNETLVVCKTEKGHGGKILSVESLSHKVNHRQPSVTEQYKLKISAGKFFKRDFVMDKTDHLAAEIIKKTLAEKEEAEKEARDRKKIEKAKRRQEVTEEVFGRDQVTAYRDDGRERTGYPVLESEWQLLPHGTYVILFKDKEEDAFTRIKETFKVIKTQGQPAKKAEIAKVYLESPLERKKKAPQPVKTGVAMIGDDAFEVQIFATSDDLRLAHDMGLNGGTYVTSKDRESEGGYEVFSAQADRLKQIGRKEVTVL